MSDFFGLPEMRALRKFHILPKVVSNAALLSSNYPNPELLSQHKFLRLRRLCLASQNQHSKCWPRTRWCMNSVQKVLTRAGRLYPDTDCSPCVCVCVRPFAQRHRQFSCGSPLSLRKDDSLRGHHLRCLHFLLSLLFSLLPLRALAKLGSAGGTGGARPAVANRSS